MATSWLQGGSFSIFYCFASNSAVLQPREDILNKYKCMVPHSSKNLLDMDRSISMQSMSVFISSVKQQNYAFILRALSPTPALLYTFSSTTVLNFYVPLPLRQTFFIADNSSAKFRKTMYSEG